MKTPASLRALLENLIDYAGLFPPAALSIKQAVMNYADYLNSEHAWMLGRFIVPAAQLDDFQSEFDLLASTAIWRISVLSSSVGFSRDLQRVLKFNNDNARRVVVDAFELKVNDSDEMMSVTHELNNLRAANDFYVFFELALNENLNELIGAINKAHAKIRAGGVEAKQIPSSAHVLNFIRGCHHYNASFKATAGLHHPLRAEQNLTYEIDAPRALMHGFLNVFLAAAFVLEGMNSANALRLLEETDCAAFTFTDEAAAWREHKIATDKLLIARRNFALSFGSCSFTEPIEDLCKLKLL